MISRTAKFGEPDERLDQAEKVAWTVGAASAVATAAASSAAMWYAAKRRGRPFRKGAPLAVVALSTLVVSQLVIGGTYVRGRNEIVFQARREAAARAEARRMEEYGWGEPAAKSVPELNRGTV